MRSVLPWTATSQPAAAKALGTLARAGQTQLVKEARRREQHDTGSPVVSVDALQLPALGEHLSAAYRSHQQLTNMLASVYRYVMEPSRTGTRIDLGWQVETMRDIADRGLKALIAVAEAVGEDESSMARFMSDDDAEDMTRCSQADSWGAPLTESVDKLCHTLQNLVLERVTADEARWISVAFRAAADEDIEKAEQVIENTRRNIRRARREVSA